MTPPAPAPSTPITDDPFDLDVVLVPAVPWTPPQRPGQVWNSGTTCKTDDGCGQTCESACMQSCAGDE